MTKKPKARRATLSRGSGDGWRMVSALRGNIDHFDVGYHWAHAWKMEAMGRLTGGFAHNFNNLLQVVQIDVEMARQRVARDDEARNYLDHALAAVQRGAQLTGQLLSFSRKQYLQPQPVDINRFIERSIELLPPALRDGLDIEVILGTDIGTALVDAPSLKTAILNIVHNSKMAMPKGGRLTIVTSGARLDEDRVIDDAILLAGDYIEILVIDTGCGMSTDVLAHAFEPFYTTREVGQGSGLGLSAVYGFARQSGGLVTLESEVGKGTSVRILLPAAVSRLTAPPRVSPLV